MTTERGERIRERIDEQAVDLTDVADSAGVSRKSVYNAIQGGASEKTYRRIEAALDAMEAAPDAILMTASGLVEFEVTGDFGVRVIVKGPVENIAELEQQVAKLIGDIRDAQSGASAGGK